MTEVISSDVDLFPGLESWVDNAVDCVGSR